MLSLFYKLVSIKKKTLYNVELKFKAILPVDDGEKCSTECDTAPASCKPKIRRGLHTSRNISTNNNTEKKLVLTKKCIRAYTIGYMLTRCLKSLKR